MSKYDEYPYTLADAFRQIGEAIDAEWDQRRIEEVLMLEWGTLDKRSSRITFTAESKYDGEKEYSWRYSYDGVPEWCESDFPDCNDYNVGYFTLIEAGVSYESCAPKWLRTKDGKLYVRMASMGPSGERECPGGYDHENGTDGAMVGTADTAGMHECPLCGESAGEEHGYIYIGESFEHIYKHVDFKCEECELTRADMTADAPMCDCDVEDEESMQRMRTVT